MTNRLCRLDALHPEGGLLRRAPAMAGLVATLWAILFLASGAPLVASAVDAPLERENAPPINSFARAVDAGAEAEVQAGKSIYQQHCAACHEGGMPRAPHREFLEQMVPKAIVTALTSGIMRQQAAALDDVQRRQVAHYLTGINPATQKPAAPVPTCAAAGRGFDRSLPPVQAGWGYDNRRFVPAQAAKLTAAEVPHLRLKWAFAFPSALRARSQPVVAMNTVFVGSQDGTVYAFDLDSGCARWTSQVSAEVRTAIVVEPWEGKEKAARPRLFFGDLLGRVYAMDALTGKLIWSVRAGDHPNATITGTPTLYRDTLYVPVSSLEVVTATDPAYACCTFRGSVVALDIRDGSERWRHFTVDTLPVAHGRNPVGTTIMGPSGAPVWNSPTVDAPRGQVYFGSGENYSQPADGNSDAVFAVDMKTGLRRWHFQTLGGDAFNGACLLLNHPNCSWKTGPDYDVAASVLLIDGPSGDDKVVAASKSGMVFGLDPATGKRLWERRAGRGSIQGGIHFGMAAEGTRLYVPIADSFLQADGTYTREAGSPGLYAMDAMTGATIWSAPAPGGRCNGRKYCDDGISAAVTAIPDVVFAGYLDGWLRAYDGRNGSLLWETDTTVPVKAINGLIAQGGSMSGPGPAVAAGHVIVNSGYGFSHHMPGNALLVFAPDTK